MLSIKIDQASNTYDPEKEEDRRFSTEMGPQGDFDKIHIDPGNRQINVAAGVGILSSTGKELPNFDAFYSMYRQAVSPSNKVLSKEKFKEAIIREAQKITKEGESRKLGFITKDIGKALSKSKWKEYETTAKKILKDKGIDWNPLPQQIKRALLHMNYVFSKGLKGFPTALNHLKNGDYEKFWQSALTRDDGSDLLLDAPDAQGNPVQGKGFGKKDFDYFKELRDDHLNPSYPLPKAPKKAGITEEGASVEPSRGVLDSMVEAFVPSAQASEPEDIFTSSQGSDSGKVVTPENPQSLSYDPSVTTFSTDENPDAYSEGRRPMGNPHPDVYRGSVPQTNLNSVLQYIGQMIGEGRTDEAMQALWKLRELYPDQFPQQASQLSPGPHGNFVPREYTVPPEGSPGPHGEFVPRESPPVASERSPGPRGEFVPIKSAPAPLGNNTADEQAAEGYLHTIPTEDNRYSPREWMAGEIESEPMDIGSGVPTEISEEERELIMADKDFWEKMLEKSHGAAMWR